MWNLIHFFAKNSPFFMWLVLAVVSIILLCGQNPYHRSIWFSSANSVVGSLYAMSNSVTGYFGLREINEDLLTRNGLLEAENLHLQQIIRKYQEAGILSADTLRQYDYDIAHVVSNSITQAENYITIDKGSADGICENQGVADQNGIVGIVATVSDHYSLIISVLNPKLRLSVKLKGSEFFGSLVWEGRDSKQALLKDLSRNVKFSPGDTIVTTGYSASFPEGVPVGKVIEARKKFDNNFLTLDVELFTDFGRLNDVHIIKNYKQDEQLELENKTTTEKK